jgi:hypothetical protein
MLPGFTLIFWLPGSTLVCVSAAGALAGACAGACATGVVAGVALFWELPAADVVDCAQTPTVMASANPARTAVLYPMRSTVTMTSPLPPCTH